MEIVRQGTEVKDTKNIYMAKQITADENGEFYADCEMPRNDRENPQKSVDGYFTIYAFAAGYKVEEYEQRFEGLFYSTTGDVIYLDNYIEVREHLTELNGGVEVY